MDENSGVYHTKIPYGLLPQAPLIAETDAEAFSLKILDSNGSPLVGLVTSLANPGELTCICWATIPTPEAAYEAGKTWSHITEDNRKRVEFARIAVAASKDGTEES